MVTLNDIASSTAAITALFAFLSSLVNRRKLNELHVIINSRLTEMLKTTGALGRSEGLAEGKALQTNPGT